MSILELGASKVSDQLMQKRLDYFKGKIRNTLELIRDDLGETRYELYMAMVDKCNDYAELREMAELEMQLEFIEYARGNIQEPLRDRQVDISDLNKICVGTDRAKFMPSEDDEIETDGFFNGFEGEAGDEAMAFALRRMLDKAPLTPDYHPGYTDEEVAEAMGETDDDDEDSDFGDMFYSDDESAEDEEDDDVLDALGFGDSQDSSNEDEDTFDGQDSDEELGDDSFEEDADTDDYSFWGSEDELSEYDVSSSSEDEDEDTSVHDIDSDEEDEASDSDDEDYDFFDEDPDDEQGGLDDTDIDDEDFDLFDGDTYVDQDDNEAEGDSDDEDDEDLSGDDEDYDFFSSGSGSEDEDADDSEEDAGEELDEDFGDLFSKPEPKSGGPKDKLESGDSSRAAPPPPMSLPPLPKKGQLNDSSMPPPPVKLPPLPGMTSKDNDDDGPDKPSRPPGARDSRPPMEPRDVSSGKVFINPSTQRMYERILGVTGVVERTGKKAAVRAREQAARSISEASRRISNGPKDSSFFSLPDA